MCLKPLLKTAFLLHTPLKTPPPPHDRYLMTTPLYCYENFNTRQRLPIVLVHFIDFCYDLNTIPPPPLKQCLFLRKLHGGIKKTQVQNDALDQKPDCQCQKREASLYACRVFVLIKYCSNYISMELLDQVYQLYIRPHLDYGEIVYRRFDTSMHFEFRQKALACLIYNSFCSHWDLEGYKQTVVL